MKTTKLGRPATAGFTLAEVMIVIAILGILAAIAIPNYIKYRQKSQLAEIVAHIDNFEKGFIAFALEYGGFPDDCHTTDGSYGLPDKLNGVDIGTTIEKYVPPGVWSKPTPLGGRYNWEGPNNYTYAGISIDGSTVPTKPEKLFRLLDALHDDGNLSTGKFRKTPNDRYTFIIRED